MTDHKPSAEALRRYPYSGGVNAEFEPAVPCTCTAACHRRCSGECGCEACKLQFAVFCDEAGWMVEQGQTFDEAGALADYRNGYND